MQREIVSPRPDWQRKVEEQNFTFHTAGRKPEGNTIYGTYWKEDVCYSFTAAEIDHLYDATEKLNDMCLTAVEAVCHDQRLFDMLHLPEQYHGYIRKSWVRRDPHVMGRFDLAYEPESGSIKMLEYNADTPTLAIETSLVQHFWRTEVKPDADQFNSFEERLSERWYEIATKVPEDETFYFASLDDNDEEREHEAYFMTLANDAGLRTKFIAMKDIGLHPNGFFCDLDDRPIRFLHKLYPWEWLETEDFGPMWAKFDIAVLEPVWKMILSNKGILPVLWELFPEHEFLLEASTKPLVGPHIAKPIFGREGANIEIMGAPGGKTGGFYADNPYVYQALANLGEFDGHKTVLGSWVVGNNAAGLIIREGTEAIIQNTSPVVPHYFR